VGTRSLALVCEDPDAPGGTFFHWGIYDLRADVTTLPEAAESLQGQMKTAKNSFGSYGYRGPCPPKGHGTHHYHFRLFALSTARLEIGSSSKAAGMSLMH
jgi:hypothetical protein